MGSLIQNTVFGRTKKIFISMWRTSNTSTGSSTLTQIKLPLIPTGNYNFKVEWGDGNSDIITAWNQAKVTHTYSSAGDYTIKITGNCTGWQFNNTGDRLKILSVLSWGNLRLGTNQTVYFYGCANLVLTNVSDILNLTGTTSLANTFRGCSSITTINHLNEWDTSEITNMTSMFQSAILFNQNIGAWNVSNVAAFDSMFSAASNFNNGSSSDINNWILKSTGTVTMSSMFNASSAFNQPLDFWNTTRVVNMSNMFSAASIFNKNIGTWDTGNVTTMNSMFRIASSFNQNIGAWNVSNVIDFSYMFYVATAFNNGGSPDINNWSLKTTGSNSFYQMFISCANFNQPVGNWNTSAVTNMAQMFQGASKFNQNIGGWNVSNVSSFFSMFNSAFVFNNGGSPDINNWTLKTNGAVSLNTMFQGGGGSYPMNFNQPIGNWNTIAVTDMAGMFQKTGNGFHSFNQPIGNWNTSNVLTMSNMFSQGGTDGGAFNQNIGAWNVSNVSDFSNMFLGAQKFNNGGSPDINNWTLKTTGSVNMSQMFASINSYISTAFNQPLGNWNTSAVTNMSQMFGATAGKVAFDQNIGNWNVSNVSNFTNFMINKSPTNFSVANLDAIYNGWSSRTVKTPITITFGTAKRTSASDTGKSILTGSPNNWVITDGGI